MKFQRGTWSAGQHHFPWWNHSGRSIDRRRAARGGWPHCLLKWRRRRRWLKASMDSIFLIPKLHYTAQLSLSVDGSSRDVTCTMILFAQYRSCEAYHKITKCFHTQHLCLSVSSRRRRPQNREKNDMSGCTAWNRSTVFECETRLLLSYPTSLAVFFFLSRHFFPPFFQRTTMFKWRSTHTFLSAFYYLYMYLCLHHGFY